MRSQQSILNQLKEIRKDLVSKYPIDSMAVFGSYARGDFSKESDVDILIAFNGKVGSKFISLADELEEILGVKVDLVSREGIKPKYFRQIEKDLVYV